MPQTALMPQFLLPRLPRILSKCASHADTPHRYSSFRYANPAIACRHGRMALTDYMKRAFISFDFDHDEELRDALKGQARSILTRRLATRLVIQITQLDRGPWDSKIQEPNVPSNPSQTASIKSFVDSLRPIVSTRSPVHRFTDDEIVDIITSVWNGILDLWPEWTSNVGQYAIQGAIGLFVIHRVASELLIPLRCCHRVTDRPR